MSQVEGTECANPSCKHHLLKSQKETGASTAVFIYAIGLRDEVFNRVNATKQSNACRRPAADNEAGRHLLCNQNQFKALITMTLSWIVVTIMMDRSSTKSVAKSDHFAESGSSDDLVNKSGNKVAKVWTLLTDPDSSDGSIISQSEPQPGTSKLFCVPCICIKRILLWSFV
jgi:hypothetical protein